MIYIKDIINICDAKLLNGSEDDICDNFSIDSRNIQEKDIFVGIKGEKYDGNLYYLDAIKKGASYCILNKDTKIEDNSLKILLVDDTVEALQKLAKYKRSLYKIPVVAVTGSVGKTSTKDIIKTILETKYKVLATTGNQNNHIGLPLTILGLKDHEALVIEMGMNHQGEIELLSNIAKPTIGVITNIGTAHIGNLKTRENILKAKLEILSGMDNGTLVINNDNDLLHTVKYENLVTTGINNKSDYNAEEITLNPFNSIFKINNTYYEIPVPSIAFVYNSLLGYAVAKQLDISDEQIQSALKKYNLSPHRLQIINKEKYMLIDDTYNASLDSIKNSLSILSKIKGRKVFIFSEILEIEGYIKEIHKEVATDCIKNKIDVVLTVGKSSEWTHKELIKNNQKSYHYNTIKELLNEINTIIKEDDTILVKGSHSTNLIEVIDYLKSDTH